MRSHRRRSPLPHVLLVGTEVDLPVIRSVLEMLPADTYGQVIVEGDGGTLTDLPTPSRVMAHRVASGGAEAAVAAWVGEWIPIDCDESREVSVWIATSSSAQNLAVELSPLHMRLLPMHLN